MKPIETHYGGCRFRSRLEARWAVFFDTLGVKWEYEPQGFETEWGGRYLPDFRLPELDTWVEVKGSADQFTEESRETVAWLIDYGGPLSEGLLLLGPVPDVNHAMTVPTCVLHQHLYWRKGVAIENVVFEDRWRDGTKNWTITPHRFPIWVRGDFDGASAPDLPEDLSFESQVIAVTIRDGSGGVPRMFTLDQRLHDAYRAARSARFEHGESG